MYDIFEIHITLSAASYQARSILRFFNKCILDKKSVSMGLDDIC